MRTVQARALQGHTYLKAETLDFVEIISGFGRVDIVGGDTGDGLVGRVVCGVEGKRALAWTDLQTYV